MSNIEDEIKNRLSGQESLDGLDTGAIWDSVAESLDSEDKAAGFFSSGRLLLGAAFLLILGGATYYFNGQDPKMISQAQYMERESVSTEVIWASNRVPHEKGYKNDAPDLESITVNSSAQKLEDSPQRRTTDFSEQSEQFASSATSNQDIRTNNPLHQPVEEQKSRVTGRSDSQNEVASQSGQSEESKNEERFIRKESPQVESNTSPEDSDRGLEEDMPVASTIQGSTSSDADFSSSKSQLNLAEDDISDQDESMSGIPGMMEPRDYSLDSSYDSEIYVSAAEAPPATDYLKKSSILPAEIYIGAGLNSLSQKYKKTGDTEKLATDLNSTSFSEIGSTTSLRATWRTRNGIRIGTGFDIDKLRNRFEQHSLREVIVTVDSQIVSINSNPQGSPFPVYGEVEYSAIETRDVIHYNHFELYSIPLEVGIEKNFKRSHIGVDLGLSYTWVASQSGRTLDDSNEISDLSDSRKVYASNGLTYQARAFLGYMLSDIVELRFVPMMRILPGQDATVNHQKHSDMIWSGQGALVIHLK